MLNVIFFSHFLRNSPLEPQFSDYSHDSMKNEHIKICDVIVSMSVVTICSSKILQCIIQFWEKHSSLQSDYYKNKTLRELFLHVQKKNLLLNFSHTLSLSLY